MRRLRTLFGWRRACSTAAATTVLLFPLLGAASEPPSDADIALAVTERLFDDAGVENALVDVTVDEGVVSLTGRVTNLMAKERAQRLAETVKGVRAVINRVEVSPPTRTDEALEADINAALAADPATESDEIQVSVENQQVTLTGIVDSWGEKTLAGRVAKQVDGVKELTNGIAVRTALERPDAEIQAEVEEILAWDVLVDDDLIDVAVKDGEVTLSGQVGSLAEKSRAINQSWVAGVKGVTPQKLEVSDWARDPRFRKQKYAKLDKPDADVAEAVRDALARDPRVLGQDVQVKVENGKAVLTGKVDGPKAKRAAAATARGTLGVYRVKNRLQVRTDMPEDEVLEERVRKAIERHPSLLASEITVSVTNGVAGLSGIVDTWYEKAEADDTAAAVSGVRAVDNDLLVKNDAEVFVADPYLDWDWYAYDFDWYRPPRTPVSAKSDWALAEDVRDELFWSPFVDSDDVTVTVDNGEVRLTGTVDSWSEWQTAAENAYEGGAMRVDNDLRVRYGPDYYAP